MKPIVASVKSATQLRRGGPRLLALAAAIVGALLIVAIVDVVRPANSARGPNKQCPEVKARQMDACASKMGFFGDRSFTVPKNQSAALKFCQQLKESIACIQAYARDCLQGFSRQLMTSLLRRGKQQHNLICSDARSRDDFRNKMSCIADDKINQLHDTMDASIVRYEHIASGRGVEPDSRLSGVCCSYQIFNEDIDATLDRICGKRSPANNNSNNSSTTTTTHELVHKVVGGTAGEFFGLICDGHRSMAECRASSKTGAYMGKLEELTRQVKLGKVRPQHMSLVPVLLEILESSSV